MPEFSTTVSVSSQLLSRFSEVFHALGFFYMSPLSEIEDTAWRICRGCRDAFHAADRRQKYCTNHCRARHAAAAVHNQLVRVAGRLFAADWLALLIHWGWRCFYCGKVLDPWTAFPDHQFPRARGGMDDISNIVPACRSDIRTCRGLTSSVPASLARMSLWQGNEQDLQGERTGLFYEFARILRELRPTWFVFENVPGLLSSNEGRDFAEVLRVLMVECGYGVSWRVLDSQFFGVAQRREPSVYCRMFWKAMSRRGSF
jgi:hypothetical protein